MKKVYNFFLLSVLFGTLSYKFMSDTATLYRQSLLSHLSGFKIDSVYLIKCSDIELPAKIGSIALIELNDVKGILKSKESVYAIKLLPIALNKDRIEITIIDFIITLKKDEIIMSNAGSEVFVYIYDNQVSRYKLLRRFKNTI